MPPRRSLPSTDRLPRGGRTRESFAATFGRPSAPTIAAMDRAGDDVPEQCPATPLALQRIGLVREAIPVFLVDPFDALGRVQLACTVEAHTSLRPGRRGIHVSRIGDLLAKLSSATFPSLQAYAAAVGEGLREGQGSDSAEVRVRGVLSYLEEVDGPKAKSSIEHVELHGHVLRSAAGAKDAGGLGFHHLSACPCVQQTLRHARGDQAHAAPPLMTHSQRCHTVVTISGTGPAVPLAPLLESVDQVVVRSRNTLPRDLELLAVHRAHSAPRFLEDVLRDLLGAVHRAIRASRPEATISIAATSLESIHDFDLSGTITASVADLDGAAE